MRLFVFLVRLQKNAVVLAGFMIIYISSSSSSSTLLSSKVRSAPIHIYSNFTKLEPQHHPFQVWGITGRFFFSFGSSFSFSKAKAVVSVALIVTSFTSSSAQLTILKKKKNFASWNLSLNFVAVSPDRMVLLRGLEKGKSKWTGNYVYGQFEVTSLHIG